MEQDISRSKTKERLPIEAVRLDPLRGYPAANKKLQNIRLFRARFSSFAFQMLIFMLR
jgi:hypothetical protein